MIDRCVWFTRPTRPPSLTPATAATATILAQHHQVGLKEWSEALEAKIGGRVSPMIYLPGGGYAFLGLLDSCV